MKYVFLSVVLIILGLSIYDLIKAIKRIKNTSLSLDQRTLIYIREGGHLAGFGALLLVASISGTYLLGVTLSDYTMVIIGGIFALMCYALLNYYWYILFKGLPYKEDAGKRLYSEYRFHFRSMFISGLIYCWSYFFIILFIVSFIASF